MAMIPLTLSEIWVYPVKSLGGVALQRARVMGKGLELDRRWMLIDEAREAMTQRVYPQMALFNVSISGERLNIRFTQDGKDRSSVEVDTTATERGPEITADVWGDKVKVIERDPAISAWFSDQIGKKCRFVAFPESNSRPVDPDFSINNEHVSLADAFPFLLISQSSLDDLNRRLASPVPMNRFRPNFVVTGGEASQEDGWRNVTIGNVRFAGVKKSARCTLITVNQATGEKGAEPLRTLSKYRKMGNNVYFGQNLITLSEGEVRVGDQVIPL